MGLLDKLPESVFGLKGEKPEVRENAQRTSQLHAQGEAENWSSKEDHSVFDFDGKKPPQYRDRSPEGASF